MSGNKKWRILSILTSRKICFYSDINRIFILLTISGLHLEGGLLIPTMILECTLVFNVRGKRKERCNPNSLFKANSHTVAWLKNCLLSISDLHLLLQIDIAMLPVLLTKKVKGHVPRCKSWLLALFNYIYWYRPFIYVL